MNIMGNRRWETGHFYFAGARTLLLSVDSVYWLNIAGCQVLLRLDKFSMFHAVLKSVTNHQKDL